MMTNPMHETVARAFGNQRKLNNRLRPDWTLQGWPYYRAIYREIAEVFDHVNWEWWKNGTFGKPLTQAQQLDVYIELCDILHFGLSLDIVRSENGGREITLRTEDYVRGFEAARGSSVTLEDALEGLAVDALLIKEFNVKKFALACHAVGLTLSGIMVFYFGKTVLNEFRWNNGYNEKTYVKMWKFAETTHPAEDNAVLATIIQGLIERNPEEELIGSLHTGELHKSLYGKLQHYYDKIER